MKTSAQKIKGKSPSEIAAEGRALLKIARQKETELRQRQLLQLGQILRREIDSCWSTPWAALCAELEGIIGAKVEPPPWIIEQEEPKTFESEMELLNANSQTDIND